MRRAAVYCRVSTLHQKEKGYSLSWQRENMPVQARQMGYSVSAEDIYVEAESGTLIDRPEFTKMMLKVQEGYYAAIFVVEKSRLSRVEDPVEAGQIIKQVQAFNCVVVTPHSTYDPSNPEGRLMWAIDDAINVYELQRIKLRMQAGKEDKLKKGGFTGGTPAYGYSAYRDSMDGKVRFRINEKEAAAIREAFKLAATGMAQFQVSQELARQGFTREDGSPHPPVTVKTWLRNPHYAGYTARGVRKGSKAKREIIETNSFYEPIISKELFQQVQAFYEGRSFPVPSRKKAPLNSIIECPSCGSHMRVSHQHGRNYYQCKAKCAGINGRYIPCEVAHQKTIETMSRLVEWMETHKDIQSKIKAKSPRKGQKERAQLQKQLDSVRRRIHSNLRDQEETYSEHRKKRILELESEYSFLSAKLEAMPTPKTKVETMPQVQALSKFLSKVTPADKDELRQLSTILFKSVRYRRDSAYSNPVYRITSFITTWGDLFKVHPNGYIYHKGEA